MKKTIILLLLSIGVANAAQSPISLAGTVFREKGGLVALRLGWERTIVFRTDTEYIYVKAAAQSFLNRSWRLEASPPDGTYSYAKTGPSTGDLTFSDRFLDRITFDANPNRPRTLRLEFVDNDVFGVDIPTGDVGRGTHSYFGTFALNRIATVDARPVANVSMRGKASAENPLIVGFVVQGGRHDVMIRVVGPSLGSFGVSNAWENPQFDLYYTHDNRASPLTGRFNSIAYYNDWSSNQAATAALLKLFSYTGAFPLENGSKDAVGVTDRMVPGTYSVVCAPESGDAGGEVLVEVYTLP